MCFIAANNYYFYLYYYITIVIIQMKMEMVVTLVNIMNAFFISSQRG